MTLYFVLYVSDYDEGVLHLVAVIASVVVFVGIVLAIKSIVGFLNRLNRREGDLRGTAYNQSNPYTFDPWC